MIHFHLVFQENKEGFKKELQNLMHHNEHVGGLAGKIKGGKEGTQLLPVVKMLKSIPEESGLILWVSLVSYL